MSCLYCDKSMETRTDGTWYWYECLGCGARSPRSMCPAEMDDLSQEVWAIDNYVCAQCDKYETEIVSLEQQLDDTKDLLHECERQIDRQQETIDSLRQDISIMELDI